MTATQSAPNLQFLTYNEGSIRTHNSQTRNVTTRSLFHGFKAEDCSKIHFQTLVDETSEFLLAERFGPLMEIHGFKVVIVKYLL